MNIEIDTKTIKNRLFKILKIKSIKDYNNLKKKINKSSEITRLILPSVIFKLSVYDYNFKYIKKPHYTFTYISFCTKIVSKFNNKLKKVLYFYKLIKNIFQKKKYFK